MAHHEQDYDRLYPDMMAEQLLHIDWPQYVIKDPLPPGA